MTDYRYPVKLDAPGRRIVPDKCRVHSSNLNFILLTYGHRFQKDDHHDLSLVSIIYHSMQRQETDRISQWSLPSAPQITPVIDTGILRDMWVMFFFFASNVKFCFSWVIISGPFQHLHFDSEIETIGNTSRSYLWKELGHAVQSSGPHGASPTPILKTAKCFL